MVSADLLILFSDVDGLYSSDPSKNNTTQLIEVIKFNNKEIKNMAGPANNYISSGGMITKIEAAKIATNSGCNVIISNGKIQNPISYFSSRNAKGSWFKANKSPKNSRKQWIAGALQVKGKIIIDEGAEKAISNGSSILPAGIIFTEGRYNKGDLIHIVNNRGKILGKGLSHYNDFEVNLLKGLKSENIEKKIGYRGKDEIIHKDDLVLEQ